MMKKVFSLIAAAMLFVGVVFAQDEGTYIDDFGPKDSSYTETDLLDFTDTSSDSKSNTGLYIGIAAVVVLGGAFVVLKKKKK